jgi:hypothetical protein
MKKNIVGFVVVTRNGLPRDARNEKGSCLESEHTCLGRKLYVMETNNNENAPKS